MLKSNYQHTVKDSFKIKGIGVHSGATATLTIIPALPSTGIRFIRTDVQDRPNIIPARWNFVTETRLCTMLSNNHDVNVSTVEHLLSAFSGLGLDNAIVEIDGPEVPIMDGSALCFVKALDEVGLVNQKIPRRVIRIKKTVSCKEKGKEISLSPADGQYFGFEIDFENPLIGFQKHIHNMTEDAYRRDIAPARTFGFFHEVEQLKKAGLARGGSLDNAIVIDGDKILNPEGLRSENEFVHHKIQDAIGDFFLTGMRLMGRYYGIRAGHDINNKLLHTLFSRPDAFEIINLGQKVRQHQIIVGNAYASDSDLPLAASA
ncbi:MAG: UDP-3-O-acyl-N-acetylglucosamine deacetylase [Alphaproteobacteria bacterium]|nr:UDP-3-O-acyl-N-acetylglucosamine deacetylase [Alphaproteobacteria bacterium]MCK5518210.1 UDP-3-O-acyl-N-acetylglucosamine deacetylase [Alphaproteobacteria bacterium]MCK5555029.1 UDP-3-O-acyl-N-acetylglucosamine deacetylase [Alphaproteobacteria bacterium]MCK5659016.1 UDP-3-O-acyl-N-acetylglucosamine deacetylase [Alphaproteobacteria bacterium]